MAKTPRQTVTASTVPNAAITFALMDMFLNEKRMG
jgi:hypothetical protein